MGATLAIIGWGLFCWILLLDPAALATKQQKRQQTGMGNKET